MIADPRAPATRPRTQVDGLDSFWETLAAAPSAALLLDYDGTLAPFAVDRMAAVPLDGVVAALVEIIGSTDTEVLIVSGRPTAEIRHLLGDLPLAVIGSHGWETALPGALAVTRALQPARAAILDAAEATAIALAGRERTERKHASVAVHLRGDEPERAAAIERSVRQAWAPLIDDADVTVRPFNGGVELRVVGWDKGSAIAAVLESSAPAFAAYLGDDDTDEDAFRVIGQWGVGIRVGEPAATLATGRLAQADVPAFLRDWADTRRRDARQ